MSFLIFDIETVPDYTLWTPPQAEPPAATVSNGVAEGTVALPAADAATAPSVGPHSALVTQKKERKARARKPADPTKSPREPFPPLYACRPIAIAMMLLDEEYRFVQVGVLGSGVYKDSEVSLLKTWSEFVYTNMSSLVTFGGRHFDLPVLSLRALRHGIAQKWLTPQVRHRYGEEHHIDLCDTLTEFGAINKTGFTLDALSQVCGLPAKSTEGNDVHAMFKAGDHTKIDAYCVSDVFRTTVLFLRHRVMRGLLEASAYREIVADLMTKAVRWNLGSVVFGVDQPRLMIEG